MPAKREGPVYGLYLSFACAYSHSETQCGRPALDAGTIRRSWKGFYWFWHKACPRKKEFLEEFRRGAQHYRSKGWPLPAFSGMFSNRYPILNVLRHGAKGPQSAPTVSRASEERRRLIQKHYEADSPDGPGSRACGPGGNDD